MKLQAVNKSEGSGVFGPNSKNASNVTVTNFDNPKVQQRRKTLDPFSFDAESEERELGQREERPLVVLDNGARYTGEWLVNKQIR